MKFGESRSRRDVSRSQTEIGERRSGSARVVGARRSAAARHELSRAKGRVCAPHANADWNAARPPIANARGLARVAGCAAVLAVACSARAAVGEPQANVSITGGVAGRGYHRRLWQASEFHLGLRGDVLFGRHGTRTFGAGPYAEVLTDGFDEIQAGAGGSLLVPILDSLPIVVSAGGYGRLGPGGYGIEPGIATSLFWGSRSYNFNANYVMAFGLLTQFRCGFGPSKETTFIIGLQADLAFLSLPIVYAVEAAKGGSKETDRVPRPKK